MTKKEKPAVALRQFLIAKPDQGRPLLDFLASTCGLSRNGAKRLLDQRGTFINRRRVWMGHHVLHPGDIVEFTPLDGLAARIESAPILHEDAHFLVIDKPPGILSNGAGSVEEILKRQHRNPELAAVHRLDRDTSGCLMFAKNATAGAKLIDLFRQKLIVKQYHAIVAGAFRQDARTISRPLEGQSAVTHVRTLDGNRMATHLQVRIETGRTHQIRRHLSALGYPVVGDRQYGAAHKPATVALEAERQMLHAAGMFFPHPFTGQTLRVKAPLPQDFRACLRRLHLT